MGEETRTCQTQVAQHHHISIFMECCCLSNVKLCCYLPVCSSPTNADALAPCENFPSFPLFPSESKAKPLRACLHFAPCVIGMDFFSLSSTQSQVIHPKATACWGYCTLGFGGFLLPRAIIISCNLGDSQLY